MSLAYFPLYPDDFEADTAHLTLAEDGAYNRLLRLCWRTPGCSIPADRAWIYRRMRALSDEDREVIDTVLDEFFVVKDGRASNARLAKEWLAATTAHERRKKAGAKGGSAKALKSNETTPSNAVAKPKQPEPEPEPDNTSQKATPSSRGARLPADWVLPRDWGQWAVGEGMAAEAVRREAEKFRDYWHSVAGAKGRKADWQATWRNWIRRAFSEQTKHQPSRTATDDRWNARMEAAAEFSRMDSGADRHVAGSLLPAERPGSGHEGADDGLDQASAWPSPTSYLRIV